jgi:L-ribulose-5-phosphate 3-epimerase
VSKEEPEKMEEMPIGVMTWVFSDPFKGVGLAQAVGVGTMQLGCPPEEYYAEGKREEVKKFVEKSGIRITTIFCGYVGESYANMNTIMETVGYRNPKLRADRIKKTFQISDFAKELGVNTIAAHIGFIPEDPRDPTFKEMAEAVRKIADYCKKNGQYFVLETGQETARTLVRFIEEVGRDNVRVNFDPANMLYYGSGDPIEALEILRRYVIGVHCKDIKMPSGEQREAVEVLFGDGDVAAERFIKKLKEIGYKGPLTIEREVTDIDEQKRDMIKVKARIEKLREKPATFS